MLVVLTSWLTSRFAQPDLTKRQLSAIITSIEQADRRYNALVKELDSAQGQVHNTEDRCASQCGMSSAGCHAMQSIAAMPFIKRIWRRLPTCTCRLQSTQQKLDALERNFQSGSDKDNAKLSGKVDPSVIIHMAEQRMEKLLSRFAADKTVR